MIDTDALSASYRARGVDREGERVLITDFRGTEQEVDLSEPPNCGGFGRIRHFTRGPQSAWPANPIPIDPACRALGLPRADKLRAQVFQNAICNWRCWYCFVPFELLAASREHASWQSAKSLIDLYLAESDRPFLIDLTGGQPDLTPEWLLWMLRELRRRGLMNATYVWCDDNLSNDYFWRHLTTTEQEEVFTYPNLGRVGCFKGFDAASFAYNTRAAPELFDRQFELFDRHLRSGVDLYAYATFTAQSTAGIADAMARFVDRLQELDEHLPLRTVPLQIEVFTPVQSRLGQIERAALQHQWRAVEAWQRELERRFDAGSRARDITDVSLGRL